MSVFYLMTGKIQKPTITLMLTTYYWNRYATLWKRGKLQLLYPRTILFQKYHTVLRQPDVTVKTLDYNPGDFSSHAHFTMNLALQVTLSASSTGGGRDVYCPVVLNKYFFHTKSVPACFIATCTSIKRQNGIYHQHTSSEKFFPTTVSIKRMTKHFEYPSPTVASLQFFCWLLSFSSPSWGCGTSFWLDNYSNKPFLATSFPPSTCI